MVLFTLSLFIFSDLTRYLLHRLLHSIPILWEFHKVHHSAKVLNPFTFYRYWFYVFTDRLKFASFSH
uniref:sterol desaturase family protein n=1 Tax=Candidatus Marithrix sp. Canyon 246 TaxID=1827136 RepID=UPI001C0C01AA|nr:sterol desaturase family protein [Candidatus Marithrix sp. Canyon 246]